MAPMFGQWRQAMQQPQQSQIPSGLEALTRNAQGGWMMPGGPSPFVPKPLAPPPQAAPPPMMGKPMSFMGGDPQAQFGMPPGFGFSGFGDIGYGGMGMGITGSGAFGDLGAFGMGYGDTY